VLATVGFDDEGVRAQSWTGPSRHLRLGYANKRGIGEHKTKHKEKKKKHVISAGSVSPAAGRARSNGLFVADSPHHVPIPADGQRVAAAGRRDLRDGQSIARVEDGIYIVGDKSWSIDMQRYNFQFTGRGFFRIRNAPDGQLRASAYQATTTYFWGALGRPLAWALDMAAGRCFKLR